MSVANVGATTARQETQEEVAVELAHRERGYPRHERKMTVAESRPDDDVAGLVAHNEQGYPRHEGQKTTTGPQHPEAMETADTIAEQLFSV